MELALSLGDSSKPFPFLEKTPTTDLGFCKYANRDGDHKRVSSDPPLHLHLLPFSPLPRTPPSSQLRLPWLNDNLHETGSSEGPVRGLDVYRLPLVVALGDEAEEGAAQSSPNSAVSSFPMGLGITNGGKRNMEAETERGSSRASDDDENGSTRKKLRLSKEQSAFLEESFKEQNTLNPKQKLALAKQLNLRPRQVEVWFQNRRARTKLKQTEVDCEYLKRCCETLTEENRRLQKELQELRALKTSQPFYMHLPATTLTMCPSCERVATTSTATATATAVSISGRNTDAKTVGIPF
ncbi:homeobox-leucine zipper protein HAT14-like [Hibiscus syriacus]|uniref:homeobox-leucine zipper protein HAT14-like n=1 Tax=Hibiscus syriacus TaxID=106335 RepID=UPI00192260D2|nr:homeobox-leucine zipper protein HAT14-like [Hibiscus syriacus]